MGIFLLGLGAVTLIALLLPGQGSLTDWWRNLSVPFFGTGRWLLPFVLLLAGWYVEWGPGKEPGAPWGRTLLGIAMAYAGLLGLLQLIAFNEWTRRSRSAGSWSASSQPLLTTPGRVRAVAAAARRRAADRVRPAAAVDAGARHRAGQGGRLHAPGSNHEDRASRAPANGKGAAPAAGAAAVASLPRRGKGRGARIPAVDAPGQTGVWGTEPADARDPECRAVGLADIVHVRARPGGGRRGPPPRPRPRTAVGEPVAPRLARARRRHGRLRLAADARGRSSGACRRTTCSTRARSRPPPSPTTRTPIHARNEEIIVRKLASFDIEAEVIGRNAGPVVTQYEVQPAPHIKLSRIEALPDDLAMALAARSIRIEAPIPGKSAVGIEIPNKEFNIVALRRILDEVDFSASGVAR